MCKHSVFPCDESRPPAPPFSPSLAALDTIIACLLPACRAWPGPQCIDSLSRRRLLDPKYYARSSHTSESRHALRPMQLWNGSFRQGASGPAWHFQNSRRSTSMWQRWLERHITPVKCTGPCLVVRCLLLRSVSCEGQCEIEGLRLSL